ncbi:DUF4157 domain-containing protein [Microcoleus sp. AT9_B5]
MSRQWAQKKSSSNSSMSVQKSSSSQRPFTAPVYDAPAPKQTPSVQAKRRNVDWNRVTVEAQSPAGVQAKLSVGAPGDKYEQEADAMANKVMTMPAPENEKPLQREMAPEEKEEEVQTRPLADSIQREMVPEEKEEEVQTKPLADSIQREMVPEEKEEEVQTKPLANSIQREMVPEEKEEEVQTKPLADSIQQEMVPEEKEEEVQTKPLADSIQREMAPEEKEEEVQTKPLANSIQREMVPEEKEEEVQTKPATEGKSQAGSNLESQLSGTKGGGSALSDEVRSHMEPRFGADFSSVRVHTDSAAVQMNRDLGAQAFTHGSDIYYGGGKSPGKDELTAHELTHVVQQNGGAVAPGGKAISQPARHDPKAVSLAHSFDNHTATRPIQRVGATGGQERKKKPDQEPMMLGALDGERPIRSPSPGSSPRASIDSNTSGTKGKDKGKGKERASAGLSNKGSNDSMTKEPKDPAKDSRGAKAGPSNRSNETKTDQEGQQVSKEQIDQAFQEFVSQKEGKFNYTGNPTDSNETQGDCLTLSREFVTFIQSKYKGINAETKTWHPTTRTSLFIMEPMPILGSTITGNIDGGSGWRFDQHTWAVVNGVAYDPLFKRQGEPNFVVGNEVYENGYTACNVNGSQYGYTGILGNNKWSSKRNEWLNVSPPQRQQAARSKYGSGCVIL